LIVVAQTNETILDTQANRFGMWTRIGITWTNRYIAITAHVAGRTTALHISIVTNIT
jgi:hypothetical protein